MRDPVEEWIADVLAGSGLSMSRRAEISEEWRRHIDTLIQNCCRGEVADSRAVRAALDAFGRPEVLRRQLRRAQRTIDTRAALSETLRGLWLLTLTPAILVAVLAFFIEGFSLWQGCAAGLAFIVVLALPMAVCNYLVVRMRVILLRPRPRAEINLPRRFLFWMMSASMALAACVLTGGLLILTAAPLFIWGEIGRTGSAVVLPFQRWFAAAVLDNSTHFDGRLPWLVATVIVASAAATLIERSRSVCAGR